MPIQITSKIEGSAPRRVWPAMLRGWAKRCPACGEGNLFVAYLSVSPTCSVCQTELHHHRADDAPPYFTMFIVGHVVVGGMLFVEKSYHPDLWLHAAIWLPMTVVLSLWLLPRIKGALIAMQWAWRMHGFDQPHLALNSGP